jgi:lipid II:glycine glycyltransferase (peptidoglycan interpeptide bridge formation enzyme)
MYEAIMKAKNDNFKYFDFWGYNHFVDESDQIYNINKFKKGFGGYYTFFAKNMNISLSPSGFYLNKLLLAMRKLKSSMKKVIRPSQLQKVN